MPREVEKYSKPIRILHWMNAGSFVLLFLTGLVLFIPQLAFLAEDGWSRLIHRIAAVGFVVPPIVYLSLRPGKTWAEVKKAFSWGSEDIGWLKAAPRFYFLNDEKGMPPQGHMNTGQKLWWAIVIVFGIIFVLTGIIMWFFKLMAPAALLQWMIFVHDIAFIVTASMLLVHIYLGVLHPLMTESWKAITNGKISVEYAKTHHSKWYEEITKSKEETV